MNLTQTPIYVKGTRRKGRTLKQKRATARRGVIRDKDYRAWILEQPCVVSGRFGVTGHHVRRTGEGKNDLRMVPLIAELHMRTHEKPYSDNGPGDWGPCVERGKKIFEDWWGVDLEREILRLRAEYLSQHP